MSKETIINKLNEAFLPENVECDGGVCMGCWKDKIREAIKMLEEIEPQSELTEEKLKEHFFALAGQAIKEATGADVYGNKWLAEKLFEMARTHFRSSEKEKAMLADERSKGYKKGYKEGWADCLDAHGLEE
jgi:hypothetical protein